jgi:kynureninase
MLFETGHDFARKADKEDPLRKFRHEFHFPRFGKQHAIYFAGNSLGLLSKQVYPAIEQELKDWKQLAVNGYFKAKNPWLSYQRQFNKPLSEVMGCMESEVTVMNALTVNLHLLMLSFYRPTTQRYKIMMEAGAFPSDQYAVETQVKFHGFLPEDAIIEVSAVAGEKTLRTENILTAIDENRDTLAMVLFGGINYYTGQLFDMKTISDAAHKVGAIAGFDLAHVAGNVPVLLHDWNIDFAAWCSYKYLNAGPGAAGGIYIHEKYSGDTSFPRLGGWWGNEETTRFKMEKGFVPQPGAGGWQMSTSQVFNMAALTASLELITSAGMENLRNKSLQLTGYLEFLIRRLDINCEVISPADPEQRGAQLSLFFKEDARKIHAEIIAKGVIADYREPGVIRIAPAPLYNSFDDVYRFYRILKKVSKRKN